MNTNNSTYIKIFWSSLFLLFFTAAVFMIKRAFNPHNRLTHIIIKPSSADNLKAVSESLRKLLYPIYMEKKGVNLINSQYPELTKELKLIFKTSKPYDINIEVLNIDITKEQSRPCLTKIARLMKKKEDKWNKKFFFAACTINSKNLVLVISKK